MDQRSITLGMISFILKIKFYNMLSSVNRARVEIGGNGTEKKIGKQVNLCVFIVTVGPSKPGPLQFLLH